VNQLPIRPDELFALEFPTDRYVRSRQQFVDTMATFDLTTGETAGSPGADYDNGNTGGSIRLFLDATNEGQRSTLHMPALRMPVYWIGGERQYGMWRAGGLFFDCVIRLGNTLWTVNGEKFYGLPSIGARAVVGLATAQAAYNVLDNYVLFFLNGTSSGDYLATLASDGVNEYGLHEDSEGYPHSNLYSAKGIGAPVRLSIIIPEVRYSDDIDLQAHIWVDRFDGSGPRRVRTFLLDPSYFGPVVQPYFSIEKIGGADAASLYVEYCDTIWRRNRA